MTDAEAFRILGIGNGASASQVRLAYRDLVKVWHPDRFQGDATLAAKADRQLRQINEAYAHLRGRRRSDDPVAAAAPPPPPPRQPAPSASPPPAAPSTLPRESIWHTLAPALVVVGASLIAMLVTVLFLLGRRSIEGPPASTAPTSVEPASAPTTSAGRRRSAPPAVRSERPLSGADLIEPTRTGSGSLVVHNYAGRDVVVVLAAASAQERAVYVRDGEQVSLVNVAPGTYRVLVMMGVGWTGDRFRRDVAYKELNDNPQFVERRDAKGNVEFTRVTLGVESGIVMGNFRLTTPFRLVRR